jgi:putative acetyltransferase
MARVIGRRPARGTGCYASRPRTGKLGPSPISVPVVVADSIIVSVRARDPEVVALLDALTSELALSGYAVSETFGYSVTQLEQSQVHLVGARVAGRLVGLGGLELQEGGIGELKRFFVAPEHRGTDVADALITALIRYANDNGTNLLRLETGDKQLAAIAFYRRHGFVEVPRFGPYVHSTSSVCMQRSLTPGDGGRSSRPLDTDEGYR